jgi:2-C-methyl-D-erythritol 4-phosphate cytidylyltransferase / 2-C-methyl-D-erythritol 2,4-cyclodiphosphate synthase
MGMKVAAVIVAGGSGLRAGGEKPKQYQLIGGVPIIRQVIETFLSHPAIHRVQTVIGEGHQLLFSEATAGLDLPEPVIGGSSRQESCRIGLEASGADAPDGVLIHDAARPFLSQNLISALIAELSRADAVIPGLAVVDTIKLAPGGIISSTVDRSSMWTVQTPQAFRYTMIRDAHRKAVREARDGFTDDAAVAEYFGAAVRIINGEAMNRKLTTSGDIDVANRELLAQQLGAYPDVRMGQGIDFHVFEKGSGVTLCGVNVPHSAKLKGHSDADVAMHALTDAVLGAIGEADIGVHFPPSDAQWKNAASSIFLAKAMTLLGARGGIISNVDVTILAESPKVAPHIAAMKLVLSPLLKIDVSRIGIKATTTEKMGAIGRKEGIAAFATATVRLPA